MPITSRTSKRTEWMYSFIILPPMRQVGFPSLTGPKDHWAHVSTGFYNSHWAHYTEVKRDGPQWLFMTFGQVYWTIVTLTKVDQAFGNGSIASQLEIFRTLISEYFQNTVLMFPEDISNDFALKQLNLYCTMDEHNHLKEVPTQWGRRLEGWPNTAARLAGWRRVTQ